MLLGGVALAQEDATGRHDRRRGRRDGGGAVRRVGRDVQEELGVLGDRPLQGGDRLAVLVHQGGLAGGVTGHGQLDLVRAAVERERAELGAGHARDALGGEGERGLRLGGDALVAVAHQVLGELLRVGVLRHGQLLAVREVPDRGLRTGCGVLLGELGRTDGLGEHREVRDLRVGVLQDPADLGRGVGLVGRAERTRLPVRLLVLDLAVGVDAVVDVDAVRLDRAVLRLQGEQPALHRPARLDRDLLALHGRLQHRGDTRALPVGGRCRACRENAPAHGKGGREHDSSYAGENPPLLVEHL